MNAFRAEIFNRVNELLPDLPGGIHWGMHVPRGGVWQNYVVLVPVTAPLDTENTGSETIELRTVRFQIYTSGLEDSGSMADTLYKGFRRYSKVLSDRNKIISCDKDAEDTFLDPDRWSDGSEIWICALQLVFTVQRSVPVAST